MESDLFQMISNENKLDGMATFVQVVEAGSFTAAATVLGHSTSFVSKAVSKLEDRLGVRLLQRTTRRLHLTEVGQIYFDRCRQIVMDAEDAEQAVTAQQETPRGKLRVSVPVSFGLGYLRKQLPIFCDWYPEITMDIELNDRMVDVVADGFDAVIRVGDLDDSDLTSRRIGSSRGLVLAAPDYWDRRGRPSHPSELAKHDCISFSLMSMPDRWSFVDPSGKTVNVDVKIRLQSNSAEMEAAMAVAGLGITRLPAFSCTDELDKGLLEPALTDYEGSPLDIHVIYPNRRHLSAKVRAFVDFLSDRLAV